MNGRAALLLALAAMAGSACCAAPTAPRSSGWATPVANVAGVGAAQQGSPRRDPHAKTQWRGDYAILADAFNMRVAGRFPFAALGADDLPRAALAQFFAEQGDRLARLRSGAGKAPGARELPCDPTQCDFVRAVDDARMALAPLLQEGTVLRLAATFNSRPFAAEGADQILRWTLSSGAAEISLPSRQRVLDYRLGEPLSLELTWAASSAWRPLGDPRQPGLSISGASVQFSNSGEWSLLRLLQLHIVPDRDDAQAPTLVFYVPLAPKGAAGGAPATWKAELYVSLTLSTVDAKTKAEAKVQLLGWYPYIAPP